MVSDVGHFNTTSHQYSNWYSVIEHDASGTELMEPIVSQATADINHCCYRAGVERDFRGME